MKLASRFRGLRPAAAGSVTLVLLGCIGAAVAEPTAHSTGIELTTAQAARLGVEWVRPTAVAEVAIASAPARVVVPPPQEALVSAPVTALVTRLLVAEGSLVEAGQALVELRSTELLSLEREYLDALAAFELAEAELERDRGLHADGIIADRRLAATEAQAEAARLRAEQSRAQLRLAGFDEARLETLAERRDLSDSMTLDAPLSGSVVALFAAVGEQLHALDPVARVADLSRLWLEVQVPQERADGIRPGMRVRVAPRGQPVTAEVIHVARVVDPVTQTVLVRAELGDTHAQLRIGQVLPAQIWMAPEEGATAAAVPAAAVVRVNGGTFVFVRTPAGFDLRPIRIVGEDGTHVYVAAHDVDPATELAVGGVSALKSLLVSSSVDEG